MQAQPHLLFVKTSGSPTSSLHDMGIMDPISLTLGILPLLGAAVKAYIAINEKIKICRHYCREIRRVRAAFEGQKSIFLNEVHLLIQPAVKDNRFVDGMLKDPAHPKWTCKVLAGDLRKALAGSYDSCMNTIAAIGEEIEELEESLQDFAKFIQKRNKGESVGDTARRLRTAIRISFDRSELERIIGVLRASNDDLRRLRKQSKELNKPFPKTTKLVQSNKQLPQEYGEFRSVKKASRAFHMALQSLFCSRGSQSAGMQQNKHSVRLFLNAKVDQDVYLDVVIACYGHGLMQRGIMNASLKKLQVRSRKIEWFNTMPVTPSVSTASSRVDQGRCKRPRVHFADDKPTSSAAGLATSQVENASPTTPLAVSDICGSLDHARSPSPAGMSDYLGDVDSCCQENFRHSFYLQEIAAHKAVPMDEILDGSIERSLTVVEQLKTARNLIAAVLKFHATPWLDDYFSLRDLCFFQIDNNIFRSLQTLHISVELIAEGNTALLDAEDTSMAGVDQSSSTQRLDGETLQNVWEEAKLTYGVRNMTLWSLGIILLQIGSWSKIEAPDDVLAVRKLSSQMSKLGPKYQRLTKQCLDCDFGYGEDLSKPRLQQAVYETLVVELSSMIKSLDLDDTD
ncbi:putative Prion-inhibition and propagation HeLo domain-containing protein [Seiridium unicorne]|uniref:Prion-inhibition and propagation HeLo domain-containing protein n=1 Tax=Seiridium unicorne TaxID=138068 RepID=A0ABR2V7J6_9PEZI